MGFKPFPVMGGLWHCFTSMKSPWGTHAAPAAPSRQVLRWEGSSPWLPSPSSSGWRDAFGTWPGEKLIWGTPLDWMNKQLKNHGLMEWYEQHHWYHWTDWTTMKNHGLSKQSLTNHQWDNGGFTNDARRWDNIQWAGFRENLLETSGNPI